MMRQWRPDDDAHRRRCNNGLPTNVEADLADWDDRYPNGQ
jgi:hypothetical protein